jgi:hypothetical protein
LSFRLKIVIAGSSVGLSLQRQITFRRQQYPIKEKQAFARVLLLQY